MIYYYKTINNKNLFNKYTIESSVQISDEEFIYFASFVDYNDVDLTKLSYDDILLKFDGFPFTIRDVEDDIDISNEEVQSEILLNQMDILQNQEFIESILSEILINQME